MMPPIAFITPTARIPYRRIGPWHDACVSALARLEGDAPAPVLALTTCTNQVSLIYALAGDAALAAATLEKTLDIVRPHGAATATTRLAVASLHQNMARLALGCGAEDAVGEHIDRMRIGEGCGEDEIHGNFIASCNAHTLARFGRDAPYFAQHAHKCRSEYARTVRREAETLFLMRQGRWTHATEAATGDLSRGWDRNVMWQLYALLIDWLRHGAVRRADELTWILDEVELEEPRLGGEEIAVAKLMLRLCAIASLCGTAPFDRAVAAAERIGARYGDHYLAGLSTYLGPRERQDPFHVETVYRAAVRRDAEPVAADAGRYAAELGRFAAAKLVSG